MRTVLVTGGAGFIGSHLVDQLLESGAGVRVLDNLSTGSLGNLQTAAGGQSRSGRLLNGSRLEVIIGDVRDRELLRKALRNVKYVFHLAALPETEVSATEPGDVHAVNVEGTLNLLHGALTEGVWRVVVASCASVYGTPEVLPVPEDAVLRPTSLFGASKVAAETYCRAFHARHQLDTVVLRYFSIFGPRQRAIRGGAVLPNLVESVRSRRSFIDQDERWAEDLTYVDDAVAATLAAAGASRAAGRVINIGSGQMTGMGDVAGILADLFHTGSVPAFERSEDAVPYGICAQTTLARELLDFAPRVSLLSGLTRMVRTLSEVDPPERAAFAPAALDD